MLLQFNSIDYQVDPPYGIILPTYYEPATFLPLMLISEDGNVIKIVAAPTLEIYLEKAN